MPRTMPRNFRVFVTLDDPIDHAAMIDGIIECAR